MDVTVTTSGGTSSTKFSDRFTFVAPAQTVTNVTPGTETISGGDTLTITGTNFTNVTGVSIGGTAVTSYSVMSRRIIVTAPVALRGSGRCAGDHRVRNIPGLVSDKLTYAIPCAAGHNRDDQFGFHGRGNQRHDPGLEFSNVTAVWFGSQQATSFTVNSSNSITAIAPAETAGAVDITVTTSGGTSSTSSSDRFTFVTPAPTVTNVTPGTETVSGGDTLTITGTNFTNVTGVSIGGTTVSRLHRGIADEYHGHRAIALCRSGRCAGTTAVGNIETSSSDQLTMRFPLRRSREAGLRRDGSWLTVTGLFWLREGANRFGKEAGNEIVLPDGPGRAGEFTLRNGKVMAAMGGGQRELRPDSDDVLKVGRLSLF